MQPTGSNADAAAAAGLSAYRARKWSTAGWSLAIGVAASLVVGAASAAAAVALGFGTLCGILNALLSMRANERLADHRNVAFFVLSSILRILVFGIVPVELALHGPWWTFGIYFIGFFLPLAVYAVSVGRSNE